MNLAFRAGFAARYISLSYVFWIVSIKLSALFVSIRIFDYKMFQYMKKLHKTNAAFASRIADQPDVRTNGIVGSPASRGAT